MRVGFYTGALDSQHQYRGIGVYSKNLLQILKSNLNVEIFEFSDPNKLPQVDLIHYPFFDLFINSLHISSIPVVVTIHDVTPLIFPDHYSPGLRGSLNLLKQKKALEKVKAVITDSQASKKDIEKYLGVAEDKIYPVYLAATKAFKRIEDIKLKKQIKNKYDLPDKFSLYVGDVNYNKNIAAKIIASRLVGLPLVICGKQAKELENIVENTKKTGPRDLIRSLMKKSHPEVAHFDEILKLIGKDQDVLRLGFVPDKDLEVIYSLGDVFLMQSLYEGFGMPILEAQACCIPVITSNISSMPEVAGDGALYVDPNDPQETATAIKKLEDQDFRDNLIKKGLQNSKKFSWDKTAEETIKIYEKVISSQ